MKLTDIHSHILPGIDDGAKTAEEAGALLRASAENGVSQIVFTPHFYSERMPLEVFLEKRNHAAELLQREAAWQESGIEARIGAEIHYFPQLSAAPLEQLCFSGTHYLLVELSMMFEPLDVTGNIVRIIKKGYRPILAHIERFSYIQEHPELLYEWVRAGALAQVNAGAVLRDKQTRKRIEQYYKWNLIHLMASDTHSVGHRPPNLRNGYECLADDEMAHTLMENASRIFINQEVYNPVPHKPSRLFGFWR